MSARSRILDALAARGTLTAAEAESLLGVPLPSARRALGDLKRLGKVVAARSGRMYVYALRGKEDALRARETPLDAERIIKDLRAELARLRTQEVDAAWVRRAIGHLTDIDYAIPEWVAAQPKAHAPGTPVLVLSDLHWGERVDSAEMGGLNGYNLAVARARLKEVVTTASELFLAHLRHDDTYPGIVVLLGGDLISGSIHEELLATNEVEMMAQVRDVIEHLGAALRFLAGEFGRVDVWGVPGNHGRITKRNRAKGKAHTSFDWLVCQMLELLLKDDERVSCHFPVAPDVTLRVAGHTIRLTHGDSFIGGDGIIGPIGPIMRGDVRKRHSAVLTPLREGYDILVCGHHHTFIANRRLVVNGTLKGHDEYGGMRLLPYEPPIQVAFTVHERLGINWLMPIIASPFSELW